MSGLKLFKLAMFSSIACIGFSLLATTLEHLVDLSANANILVYRWSSQVAIIKFHKHLEKSQALQLPLGAYYNNKKPLPDLLKERGSLLNDHSLWKKILSSPLEVHSKTNCWQPSLYLFNKLGIQVKWHAWQVTLEPPLEEAPQLRHFIIYTATGEDLDKWGIAQHTPCWIENHDTVHKWAMFLMDIESPKSSNLP